MLHLHISDSFCDGPYPDIGLLNEVVELFLGLQEGQKFLLVFVLLILSEDLLLELVPLFLFVVDEVLDVIPCLFEFGFHDVDFGYFGNCSGYRWLGLFG